jgi:Tfp pilus assembly protein PilF
MSLATYSKTVTNPPVISQNNASGVSTNYGALASNYDDYLYNHVTFPQTLLNPDPSGNYDTIDNSGNLIYKYDQLTHPNPNLRDALIADNQSLLVQQNTMYIVGTITSISLIIFAIMLSRKG